MKKIVICIFAGFFCLHGFCENISKIIAQVNNEVITSKDLDDYCNMVQYRFPDDSINFNSNKQKVKEELLKNLIDDRLILDKAKKDNTTIAPTMIDAKLKEMSASYPSREEFENSLVERGLTVSQLKEKIREQFLVKEAVNKYVKDEVTVSPQEISRFYTEHNKEMTTPQTYLLWVAQSKDKDKLSQIAKTIDEKGIEKASQDYQGTLLRIESSMEELKEDIAGVVKSLQEKKFSVKETADATYLIYLDKIVAPHTLSLDSAKEKIRAYIWKAKFTARFKEWVNELKDKATINIYAL